MGYSGRYHAASLAAVFLALAVGILIGVGFGSDVVTGTAETLEEGLGAELTETRERVESLEAELEAERNLARDLYPAIVGNRLGGEQVAIVGIGGLPEEVSSAVEAAVEPAGASLSEVAVVSAPPDLERAVDALAGPRARELPPRQALTRAARSAGTALATGGERFDDARRALLSRYSGTPVLLDDAVLFRQVPEDMEPRDEANVERLETGLIQGLTDAGVTVVGVERSEEETSSIGIFDAHDLSSVDNVDSLAGQVALVFALGGAEGSFGTKETADRLLPELLPPAPGRGR